MSQRTPDVKPPDDTRGVGVAGCRPDPEVAVDGAEEAPAWEFKDVDELRNDSLTRFDLGSELGAGELSVVAAGVVEEPWYHAALLDRDLLLSRLRDASLNEGEIAAMADFYDGAYQEVRDQLLASTITAGADVAAVRASDSFRASLGLLDRLRMFFARYEPEVTQSKVLRLQIPLFELDGLPHRGADPVSYTEEESTEESSTWRVKVAGIGMNSSFTFGTSVTTEYTATAEQRTMIQQEMMVRCWKERWVRGGKPASDWSQRFEIETPTGRIHPGQTVLPAGHPRGPDARSKPPETWPPVANAAEMAAQWSEKVEVAASVGAQFEELIDAGVEIKVTKQRTCKVKGKRPPGVQVRLVWGQQPCGTRWEIT